MPIWKLGQGKMFDDTEYENETIGAVMKRDFFSRNRKYNSFVVHDIVFGYSFFFLNPWFMKYGAFFGIEFEFGQSYKIFSIYWLVTKGIH